jgi:hypothetical protein
MDTKEKRIEETLQSIDGLGRANANPFLFQKVMNRMGAAESKTPRPAVISWSVALAVILIALNMVSLLHYTKEEKKTEASETTFAQDYFSYLNNNY